ncbi:hypothetical protein PYCCODRAFT_1422663 [Trametes coccinea BRFM310]|uniref:Transcription initiation factor IIF subunit beta n=1 Tax=Trametes coccinea (strain BRFM310) TaxID=1353009 RepID=A0A1Y2J0Q4_TRAC3|nr:hypothetical protein PYCCODRAFT_1422663 [Trametes coccinea BRFM310]
MKFTALDEYSPEVHGSYDDWEPMDSSADDEGLMQVEPGDGQLLMVKIPKHLMERWSAIDEEDVHLATIRVYHPPHATPSVASSSSTAAAKPRIVLTLPPDPDDDRLGPDEYEMQMSAADAAAPFNEYVVAEYDPARARSPPPGPAHARGESRKGRAGADGRRREEGRRRRQIALAGMVTHHCNLRSVLSERLRQRVKARSVEANTPKRQTILLDHGAWRSRMAASARGERRPFLIAGGCKKSGGTRDLRTRLPRAALLDMLFRLFEAQTRWTFKALRERTQQPEAYLKEILPEVAYTHKTGQHRGLWELSAIYKYKAGTSSSTPTPPSASAPTSGEGEDDSEDDSDMEDLFC